MVAEAGRVIGEIGEKFVQLRADQELTRAENEMMDNLEDIYQKAMTDEDAWTVMARTQAEVNSLGQKLSKGISLPATRTKFEGRFKVYSTRILQDLQSHTWDRQAFLKFTEDEEYYKRAIENYGNTDEEGKTIISNEVKTKLFEDIGLGYRTKESAISKWKELQKAMIEGSVRKDILENPQRALDQLLKRKEGKYKDLTPEQFAEFTKDAQTEIERLEGLETQEELIRRNRREEELISKLLDGTLTTEEIISDRENEEITPSFADSLKSALTSSRAVTGTTDIRTYSEIMDHITRRDISATEIREEILEKSAQGKLSFEDTANLLYMEKGEEDIVELPQGFIERRKEYERLKAFRAKENFWGNIWEMVFAVNPFNAPFVIGKIIDRARQQQLKREQIFSATEEEIKKQIVEDNPWISKLPPRGKLCVDRYGNKAIVYPDGSYEEVISKEGVYVPSELRKRKKE